MTVITLTNVSPSLRGDLTKWMQEIATGVYVGNFNVRIREELWKRVVENIGKGQATITYATRNELGYSSETHRTYRQVIDYEGIPLVLVPNDSKPSEALKPGFSNAGKFAKVRKITKSKQVQNEKLPEYVVLDIETDGLNENINHIIEIGALKVNSNQTKTFNSLIEYKGNLPTEIVELTNITDDLLSDKGQPLVETLKKLQEFIGDDVIVGYSINFDITFINHFLELYNEQPLQNETIDILQLVKREKVFIKNYKLETVLQNYEFEESVPHRALSDTRLINELASKVKGFTRILNRKG